MTGSSHHGMDITLSSVPRQRFLVGHFIGMAIVTVVSLTVSLTTAVIALAAYIVYVQIENYVITPRIMRKSLAIPGLVTIIAALLGASLLEGF